MKEGREERAESSRVTEQVRQEVDDRKIHWDMVGEPRSAFFFSLLFSIVLCALTERYVESYVDRRYSEKIHRDKCHEAEEKKTETEDTNKAEGENVARRGNSLRV